MTKIKNIIFDLGGVILNLDYSKTDIEFHKLGLNNFSKLYSKKKQSKIFDDFEKGRFSAEKFIFLIKQAEKIKIKDSDFVNAWNAMLLEIPKERMEFIKRLVKLINTYLKIKKLKLDKLLLLISNKGINMIEKQLMSDWPSLRLFNLYKLLFYIREKNNV